MASSSSTSNVAASSMSSSSATYDVFLSFRGEDTRKGFTSHLYEALKQQGYCVFHDTLLTRGELVSSGLLEAIADSKLSIVIFSRNYAGSRWCLDELVKIMECWRSSQQIVLPVFYDVEPSHVRNQDGEYYAAAFIKHEQNHEVEHMTKWKEALNEAGNLSGLHLNNDSNGDEADFVRKIVKRVAARVDEPYLQVADNPVGIDSHVHKLNGLLSLGTNDVRAVAIWGIGGIGKTTIAKAVFNEIYKHFHGSCFLEDVRETVKRPNGSVELQEKLISGVFKQSVTKIDSSDHGIQVIKRKLRSRQVLIVLDDVDEIVQLEKLAMNKLSWLAQGSRVIVTTRDKSCVASLDAKLYETKPLDEVNSLELFKRSAFGEHYPKEVYKELSKKVVEYAGGIPLVLKILGPYMKSLGAVEKWQMALERLKVIPHERVKEKLILSFDSLNDREKKLFLDIVGFFIGMKKDLMLQGWAANAQKEHPEFDFETLLNRCLVEVDVWGKLQVHDVLRDMGRAIIREESKEDLKRYSRLWQPEDVFNVLKESQGEKATESIILELPASNEECVDINAFAEMSNLRLIHISHLKLVGTYNGVLSFDKLTFMSWYGFPLKSIPPNLEMRSLVVLHMQESKLRQLWTGTKVLNKLRFLDVSDSYFLTSTPDLSGAVNLEQIRLCNCKSLVEVHPSIQHLRRLVVFDLSGCYKLFEKAGFEVSLSNLWRLFSSMLSWISPTKRPTSSFLTTSFHWGLSSLTKLSLSDCNLTDLPGELGNLISLSELNLCGNNFSSIPATIKNLQRLQVLNVNDCHELKTIADPPNNLIGILAKGCESLEAIQVSSERSRELTIVVSEGSKLTHNIFTNQEQLSHFSDINIYVLPSDDEWKIPPRFNYQGLGPFISFVVPQHPNTTNTRGWLICIIHDHRQMFQMAIGNVYNKTKDLMYTIFMGSSADDMMLITYVEHSKHGILVEEGDEIEILFVGFSSISMCGLRIMYDDIETDDELVIQYSPRVNIDKYYHDGNSDYEAVGYFSAYYRLLYPVEYLSNVMIAWIKPMLRDLRHFDSWFFLELLKDMAAGRGTRIPNEYGEVYRIFANSVYTWYLQTSTSRPPVYLKLFEEEFNESYFV